MVSFSDLGIGPAIVRELNKQGISEPFEVQKESIPDSLVGVKIRLVGLFEFALLVLAINGSPNANVLPEPVGALQQTSLPNRESGILSF